MREDESKGEPRCEGRRRLLLALAGAGVAALSGCREAPKSPPGVEIPLSKIPQGGRVVVPVGSQPVEFQRAGTTVTARSLACTHQGCEVFWVEEEKVYRCPCHAGVYDPLGNVVGGPPPAPLRTIPTEVRGDAVFAHL